MRAMTATAHEVISVVFLRYFLLRCFYAREAQEATTTCVRKMVVKESEKTKMPSWLNNAFQLGRCKKDSSK